MSYCENFIHENVHLPMYEWARFNSLNEEYYVLPVMLIFELVRPLFLNIALLFDGIRTLDLCLISYRIINIFLSPIYGIFSASLLLLAHKISDYCEIIILISEKIIKFHFEETSDRFYYAHRENINQILNSCIMEANKSNYSISKSDYESIYQDIYSLVSQFQCYNHEMDGIVKKIDILCWESFSHLLIYSCRLSSAVTDVFKFYCEHWLQTIDEHQVADDFFRKIRGIIINYYTEVGICILPESEYFLPTSIQFIFPSTAYLPHGHFSDVLKILPEKIDKLNSMLKILCHGRLAKEKIDDLAGRLTGVFN